MAARAFLFDLDGTIWDSRPWYVRLCELSGGDPRVVLARLGTGESIVAVFRSVGITKSRYLTLCRTEAKSIALYPGVLEGLQTLARRGTPLGVVTNLPEWIAEPLLEKTGTAGFFAACRFRAGKPSPRGVSAALNDISVDVENRVIYVGDQVDDALAAKGAGVGFAWASYGYGERTPPETDVVLHRFSDVVKL